MCEIPTDFLCHAVSLGDASSEAKPTKVALANVGAQQREGKWREATNETPAGIPITEWPSFSPRVSTPMMRAFGDPNMRQFPKACCLTFAIAGS
jgi:hypothetical protein